jgi:hypothetical protein
MTTKQQLLSLAEEIQSSSLESMNRVVSDKQVISLAHALLDTEKRKAYCLNMIENASVMVVYQAIQLSLIPTLQALATRIEHAEQLEKQKSGVL